MINWCRYHAVRRISEKTGKPLSRVMEECQAMTPMELWAAYLEEMARG